MEEFHSEARLQEWKESIEDEIRGTWNEWCGSIYTTMMGELTVRFARERAEMEEKILLERQSIMNEVEKMIARSSEGMGRKRSEERKWEETENERKEMEKKIAEQQQEERNVKETMVGQNTEMQAENVLWKCSFAQDMLSNWTEWSGVVLANIRSEFQRSVQWEREEFEERLLCERQTIIKEAETLMAGKDEAAEIESEEAGPSRQGWREEEDLIMKGGFQFLGLPTLSWTSSVVLRAYTLAGEDGRGSMRILYMTMEGLHDYTLQIKHDKKEEYQEASLE
ncbi:hypothetical protein ANANG_G00144870 [Anguilla anguilla]|uniref:Uncharacterized protein n=1 Tax=Anguilla anguilla TaxID=7936 RepID=A0A9D3MDG5_ANGAN|nr:hypothetical protein ANANG_G00144870 [Anguilla anguilla]